MAASIRWLSSSKAIFSYAIDCLQGTVEALSNTEFFSFFLLRRQSSDLLRTEVIRYERNDEVLWIRTLSFHRLQKTSSTISSANSWRLTIRFAKEHKDL